MKRFALQFLAVSSLLIGGAMGATRPHYGGTLHVLARSAAATLDPSLASERVFADNISRLLFDTLVSLDDRGNPRPALAIGWQADPGNQSWQFTLRPGVTFSDGTQVTADIVAASLRVANASWHVIPSGDGLSIQTESADIDLPAELALPVYSVVRRENSKLLGTGPFVVSQWQPSRKLSIAARNDYWNGRPFLDAVEIDLTTGAMAADSGQYQLAGIAPEQARRAANNSRQVEESAPTGLLALVFAQPPRSPGEGRLREALSLSVDRKTINEVLLQGTSESARALLPEWMTGYSFLFTTDTNLPLARQLVSEAKQATSWTLSYDAADANSRLIAERIALNARDAGINLLPTGSSTADIRLQHLTMASLDAHIALSKLAVQLGLPAPKFTSASSEELYAAERALMQSERLVPLVHLRQAFSLAPTVANWSNNRNGAWHLPDVWLTAERP